MLQALVAYQPVVNWIFQALVNGMFAGIALTLLTVGLLRLLSHSNATTRYLIWEFTLLAVIALPFFMADPPPTESSTQPVRQTAKLSANVTTESSAPYLPKGSEISPAPGYLKKNTPKYGESSLLPGNSISAWPETSVTPHRANSGTNRKPWVKHKGVESSEGQSPAFQNFPLALFRVNGGPWTALGLLLWALASMGLLARLVGSCLHLQSLKKRATLLSGSFQDRVRYWCSLCLTNRPVKLGESSEVAMPLTAGFSRPFILLPENLPQRLSETELDHIGLHEAAHLRRRDDWTNLGQKVCEALFFFHPAVHWIGRQMDLEREIACDDWVISVTGDPRPYAACLTRLAELMVRPRNPLPAPGVMMIRKHLTRRVEMLLNRGLNRSVRFSKVGLILVLGLLTTSILYSAHLTPLISFCSSEALDEASQATRDAPPSQSVSPTIAVPSSRVAQAIAVTPDNKSKRPVVVAFPKPQPPEDAGAQLGDEVEELTRQSENLEREIEKAIENLKNFPELEKQLKAQQGQIGEYARRLVEKAKAFAKQDKIHIDTEAIEQAVAQAKEAMVFHLEEFNKDFEYQLKPHKSAVPESELLPRLSEIAKTDSSLEVRKEAIKAIGRTKSDASISALIQLYDLLDNKDLKKTILTRLIRSNGDNSKALGKLRQVAQSASDPELRGIALEEISRVPEEKGVDTLSQLYDATRDAKTKQEILHALSHHGSQKAIQKLLAIAQSDSDPQMRLEAVKRLGATDEMEWVWDFNSKHPDNTNAVPNVTVIAPPQQKPLPK